MALSKGAVVRQSREKSIQTEDATRDGDALAELSQTLLSFRGPLTQSGKPKAVRPTAEAWAARAATPAMPVRNDMIARRDVGGKGGGRGQGEFQSRVRLLM